MRSCVENVYVHKGKGRFVVNALHGTPEPKNGLEAFDACPLLQEVVARKLQPRVAVSCTDKLFAEVCVPLDFDWRAPE